MENYANYHVDVAKLMKEIIGSVITQLLQEQSVLFKEKINFKLPGGAGFACHLDTPAYLDLVRNIFL